MIRAGHSNKGKGEDITIVLLASYLGSDLLMKILVRGRENGFCLEGGRDIGNEKEGILPNSVILLHGMFS